MSYGQLLQIIPRLGRVWTLTLEFKLLEEPAGYASILQFRKHDNTDFVIKVALLGTGNSEEFFRIGVKPPQAENSIKLGVKRNQIKTGLLNQWHNLQVISTLVARPNTYYLYVLFNEALVDMKTTYEPMTIANALLYHREKRGSQPKIILRDLTFNQTEGKV